MDTIINLLASSAYIIVNKKLIQKLGLDCAVMIGELCSEYTYWKNQDKLEEGFFFSTRENIFKNTGLSNYNQRKALGKLVELQIVSEQYKGLPAKKWYSLNLNKLDEILEKEN